MNPPEELLNAHGWSQFDIGSSRFHRSHCISDCLWTEEIDFTSLERVTYIRIVKLRRSSSDRALGAAIQAFAPGLAQIAAGYTPMGRTGIGKLRAYHQSESLAKSFGEHMQEDVIDMEKLFLVRSRLPDAVEELLKRDSSMEAKAHVYLMISLQNPC